MADHSSIVLTIEGAHPKMQNDSVNLVVNAIISQHINACLRRSLIMETTVLDLFPEVHET